VIRWWSRLFRPEAAFFLLCWLGLTVRFQSRAFDDPGALWHVKVGERILADGFMHTDPFTYTFAGRTWIPQQWGGEVLLAVAHRVGGFDAMLLGMATLVAGLFTWVFSRMVRGGMHPALAGVVTGGALVVSAFHFYARPHMFTIVGMGVTMAAIVDYERGRASAWRLWWLIPFNVLWTNIHGGVLGGVLTLGMAVAGWVGVFLTSRDRQGAGGVQTPLPGGRGSPITNWRTATLLAAIVAACGLTPFVNPFGLEMLRTWQKIVGSEAMKELVSEHQPLSLGHTAGQVVAGFAAFYLFLLIGTLPKLPRVSWLLPLVWLMLSLKGIRQGPLFAVVGAVAVADIWPHTVWHRLLKKYGDSLARDPADVPSGRGWTTVPVAAVLIALALQMSDVRAPVVGRGWAKLNPATVPVELTESLNQFASFKPGRIRLFNDANLGGYVIYHVPQMRVFMDDRFELYGDDWIRSYVDVVYDHPERFEDWEQTYRFNVALVSVLPGEDRLPLEKYLSESPRWEVLYRCDRAVFFRHVNYPD
jgi:hypothetical protein